MTRSWPILLACLWACSSPGQCRDSLSSNPNGATCDRAEHRLKFETDPTGKVWIVCRCPRAGGGK